MRRAGLALVVAATFGCADEPGPLDRETVAEIARSQGDAQGGARTGTWDGTFVQGACDCPSDLPQGVCLDDAFEYGVTVPMRLVEGDGVLLLAPQLGTVGITVPLEFSGPIDADDTFVVGLVGAGLGFTAELLVIGRLDAVLDDDEHFSGVMDLRMRGEFGERTFDCDSTLDLEARRAF